MKRMVLMLGILAVLVLSSLGGMAFAADTSEQMRGLLDKAQEYADRKDSESLLKQAEKMSAFIEFCIRRNIGFGNHAQDTTILQCCCHII